MGKITKRELSPALVQEIDEIKYKIDNLDLSAENVTLDSPDFQSTNVKDGMQELFTNVDKHVVDNAIHKTSRQIRAESETEFIMEVRINDPVSPAVGRMWFRSDL